MPGLKWNTLCQDLVSPECEIVTAQWEHQSCISHSCLLQPRQSNNFRKKRQWVLIPIFLRLHCIVVPTAGSSCPCVHNYIYIYGPSIFLPGLVSRQAAAGCTALHSSLSADLIFSTVYQLFYPAQETFFRGLASTAIKLITLITIHLNSFIRPSLSRI